MRKWRRADITRKPKEGCSPGKHILGEHGKDPDCASSLDFQTPTSCSRVLWERILVLDLWLPTFCYHTRHACSSSGLALNERETPHVRSVLLNHKRQKVIQLHLECWRRPRCFWGTVASLTEEGITTITPRKLVSVSPTHTISSLN